mmetsp:Transcript_34672/g.72670  ORF Transcript_34672/g.72670 Transcript_34672/m.72670 type:complete len:589 (-) Transcript_34672:136-1902(-)|eukprot:CAMPEP_0201116250 /NCGR_PEP_ID=MMETSP0850-20130426/589_1 /ASSEMBLY_ACC=CAM_ASM_000622 /TAXON_ID=183588 /ORGANISM="Pseudo-nitzschia fraudulenta, Strain WWA7" /LENGTH=588 /DNA_ID=CAMNT_0047380291 /DNA_START=72 /DNA_END=1838 /DNA_ORIENTATION=+
MNPSQRSLSVVLAMVFLLTDVAVATTSLRRPQSSTPNNTLAAYRKFRIPKKKRGLQQQEAIGYNDSPDGFDFGEWVAELWEDFTGLFGGSGDGDGINWGKAGAWNEWLSASIEPDGRADGIGGIDLDVCTLVELAIGMGPSFGIEANCECTGDFGTGLTIGCSFDECAPGEDPDVCGTVDLSFEFGGPDGTIAMTACADYEDDQYEETCFSYGIDVRGDDNTAGLKQTCEATYGGEPCGCEIENHFCLSVDCSALLPGAKMGTCQFLSMADEIDSSSWFPDFEIFQPGFELLADEIPWDTLAFDVLDLDNFDVSAIQWWGSNLTSSNTTWVELLRENPTAFVGETIETGVSAGVCAVLAKAVNLTDDMGIEDNCECGKNDVTGDLEVSCSFEDYCTVSLLGLPLCGAVDMNVSFRSLTEVDVNICVRYELFPETCYSYEAPIIGTPPSDEVTGNVYAVDSNTGNGDSSIRVESDRECSVSYGGEENYCKCTMDENSCMTVDCTEFEALAVTDHCQPVNLLATSDPSELILAFRAPGAGDVVSDGIGGEFVSQSNNLGRPSGAFGGSSNSAIATALSVVAAMGLVLVQL